MSHTFTGAQKYLPPKPLDRLYPTYQEAETTEFIVEPAEISFDLGAVEPFRGSLTLYNFAKKKRISETYYFHCNDRQQLAMLSEEGRLSLPEAAPAVFRFSQSSPDIFFVLRIEKILQGDVDTVAEPYLKHDTIKAKEKEKYAAAAAAAASRYNVWQPFGWAAVPLMNEENAIPDQIIFKPIYRTREQDISDVSLITTHSEGKGSSKKYKSLPGRCVIRLKVVPPADTVPGRLSPSLVPVKPVSDRAVFREIQEFPLAPVLTPYREYVNDLFLYIDMANLSSRTGTPSAKDIAIEVKLLDSDEDITAPGLPILYSPGQNTFIPSVLTPVVYHNKAPSFYTEIKIQLPPVLHATHHLVFTFFQVNLQSSTTKATTKGSNAVMQPIGYSFWAIYPSDRVVSKETLPIYVEPPNSMYLSDPMDLKPLDGGKGLLTVRTKMQSTIYTQDIHMNNVLRRMRPVSSSTKMDLAMKPLEILMKAHPARLIKFFPVLLHYILQLLTVSETHATQVFSVIPELIVGVLENAGPTNTQALLRAYSDNTFDLCEANEKGHYVHDILVKEWLLYVREASIDCEVLLKFSSFFFKIIFKSMVLKIYNTGELSDESTRKGRFSDQFATDVRGLVAVLAWEICQRCKSALTVCKDLSRNIAAFFNDLFAVADRGVVLQAVYLFLHEVSSSEAQENNVLSEFKFEFMRVLLENEHFLVLNLPRSSSVTLPPSSEVMGYFLQHHHFAALLVRDLGQYLQQENKSTRIQALDVARRAFFSFDLTLTGKKEKQSPAFSVFFPLLSIIIDHPIAEDTVLEEQRDFMVCFLFLLKHTERGILRQWFKRQSIGDMKRFFQSVASCIRTFQFMEEWEWKERMTESSEVKSSAAMKESIESFYSAGGVPKRTTFRQQRADAKATQEAEGAPVGQERAFRGRTLNRGNTATKDMATGPKYNETMEANLSSEAMYTLTEVIRDYLDMLPVEDCNQQLFEKVSLFIVTVLMNRQSIDFLQDFFAFLRFFVEKFGLVLFKDSTFLGQICFHVMNYCNSSDESIRQQASALLFLLMQKHFSLYPDQFQRIAVHITVAVSRLVGRGLKGQTDSYLKSSLSAVLGYAQLPRTPKALATHVQTLLERLFTVLEDNMKISSLSDDPEMMGDLYHRLANGYVNAPSLRITWLESLGSFHSRRGRFAESAMCNLHIAAMIAEYLNIVQPIPGRPNGCAAFMLVSPNILEETTIRDTSVISGDSDESGVFTEEKMHSFLIHAIAELEAGDLFETAADVYKLILPLHEKNLQFEQLQSSHLHMSQIFGNIVDCVSSSI